MDQKKVLFITPSLCQGGIEHSMITMLNLLDKTKYDITLFIYHDDITLLPLVPKEVRFVKDNQQPHYYRKPKAVFYNGIKLVSNLVKAKKVSEKISTKLKKYIHLQKVKHPYKDIFRKEKFDIVISYAIGICTEMALCFKAEKYYVFFHSSVDLHHEMLEKIFPLYNKIVAVSDGVKEMLTEKYPHISDRIVVLKNYVDAQKVVDKSNECINIKDDKLVLCTCGRLSSEKGFDLAVESANILRQKGIDFIWYFVGDGDERIKVEELINKYKLNDYIKITGYVENPYPYIKACDIYIQPSYHESFGLTIKESVILGKTVVSTDTVGGNTVLEKGKYGEIVPISAEGIAQGVLTAQSKAKQGSYKKYDTSVNDEEKNKYISQLEDVLGR